MYAKFLFNQLLLF